MMEPTGAPLEWVAGRSRFGWWVGWYLIFVAVASGSLYLINWALSALGAPQPYTGTAYFVLLLIAWPALAGLAIGLYTVLVPMPMPAIGLSPGGVSIVQGIRPEFWPAHRMHLVSLHLHVFGKRIPWQATYRVTPEQAKRLAAVIPAVL